MFFPCLITEAAVLSKQDPLQELAPTMTLSYSIQCQLQEPHLQRIMSLQGSPVRKPNP